MQREKDLKRYSKVFIENLSKVLRSSLSISTDIYPIIKNGALLQFTIDKSKNKIEIHSAENNIHKVLDKINQDFISGDIANFIEFRGTNIFMKDNKVTIIKSDDDQNFWSNRAAINDVNRIIHPHTEVAQ